MVYIETKLLVGNEQLTMLPDDILNELNDYFSE